jgi:hypothetical protein
MNSALTKLGADLIISPDDNNQRAKSCKLRYPVVRDLLLRSHPWNFAIGYSSLAAITPKPDAIFDYQYVFQIPSDFLRVLETNLCDNDKWEELEGGRIGCNVSAIKIKGVKRITDVTKYDSNFCEVLAFALAKDLSYLVTQSSAQVKQLGDDHRMALREARSFDAQVGSVRRVISDDWLNSRRY